MSKIVEDKFKFKLANPIKVQANIDGENTFSDLKALYLKAPTYRHRDKTLVLKKMFIGAIFGMTSSLNQEDAQARIDDASDTKDNKIDAKSAKVILYSDRDFDLDGFYKKFTKLLLSDICFKDEQHEQPILSVDVNKLSEDDFEELVAKYIEFFFATSWMKTLESFA